MSNWAKFTYVLFYLSLILMVGTAALGFSNVNDQAAFNGFLLCCVVMGVLTIVFQSAARRL
jgi:hypothetical protein